MNHMNWSSSESGTFLLLSLVIGMTLQQSQSTSADEPSRRLFLAEAPAAWARYSAAMQCVQGTAHNYWVDRATGEGDHRIDWQFSVCGDNGSAELRQQAGDDTGMTHGYGRNSDYCFGVKQSPGNPGWMMTSVNDVDPNSFPSGLSRPIVEFARNIATAPVYLGRMPLSTVIADESFQLDDVREISEDGRRLLEVTFHSDLEFGRAAHVRRGRLMFDRLNDCILVQGKLECVWPASREYGTIDISTVVGELPGGLPFYRSYREHILGHSDPSESRKTASMTPEQVGEIIRTTGGWETDMEFGWEYRELRRVDRIPDSAFRLTRYGLPEPAGKTNSGGKTNPWIARIVVLNLVLLLVVSALVAARRTMTGRKEALSEPGSGADSV